ncbi:pyridoxamine 5'-phosphate oxidase family protein [Sulfitobacter dubius]|uniref:pyridoxamine 5'-phosphate oxidase family protein n=1 Tax=Sulfitobacter dubius TaxID=218673 RepID=UPI0008F1A580|nr:pyridoxamine 5'-phosphate oxidase family protein [Sulfitobacter dubius]SFG54726.1 Ferredoxin-NADP reductase [Sulfitobacter dubius]
MEQMHKSHWGELALQARRHTPQELSDAIPHYIYSEMPQQHAGFFAGLSYLPLGTLDRQGRPWVSLLVTQSASDPSLGIHIAGENAIQVVAQTNPFDPFVRAISQDHSTNGDARLFAGVGVDFSNRRRNKISGLIEDAAVEGGGKIKLNLTSNQHLGNCPKYITVRALEYAQRSAKIALDRFDVQCSTLPEAAKSVVARASTVFMATKHTSDSSAQSDMGVNHRGGAPGFVRLYEAGYGDTYLVLPDHSGNRFYQSLGNIETDPQVGLVFPDFDTGEVLYITGEAENLLGADADALMPRTSLLTRIKVTGAVFVRGGLNLKLTSQEELSPYNPPVKLLRTELEQSGHAIKTHISTEVLTATLVSTKTLSLTITTFDFELSQAVQMPLPGGFGVFDFSGLLHAGYSHMNEANPQLVNEDFVRTWTVSNAPDLGADRTGFGRTNRVSVTVKRKPGGLMSNVLHDSADQLLAQALPIQFKGMGAGFTCFSGDAGEGYPKFPEKMLWVAGGVGITPFMAMWDGIQKLAMAHPQKQPIDIVLLFSGRDDDIAVLHHFVLQKCSELDPLRLQIVAFQSAGENLLAGESAWNELRETFAGQSLERKARRMQPEDVKAVAHLGMRDVYMCGPDAMMNSVEAVLDELSIEETRRHRETFVF